MFKTSCQRKKITKIISLMPLGILFIISGCSWLPAKPTVTLPTDLVINKISASLPTNWRFERTAEELRITRAETVQVIFENKINEPVFTPQMKEQRNRWLETAGTPTICELRYKLATRWSEQDTATAISANAEIQKQIDALPEKYNLTALYDSRASSKQGPTYNATTPEEKKRLADYEAEKKTLTEASRPLPDGHTELYSIFLVNDNCRADEFHTIWPDTAAQEILGVRQKIKNIITTPADMSDAGGGYFKDKTKVYYESGEERIVIDEADPSTFRVLADGIAQDAKYVYFFSDRTDLDSATFRYLNSPYFLDKNGVYYLVEGTDIQKITKADPASFMVLNSHFAKDKAAVYYQSEILKTADVKTFVVINEKYSKDARAVYFDNGYTATIIPEANPQTFKP